MSSPRIESDAYQGEFDGTYVSERAPGSRFSIAVDERLHHEQSAFQKIAIYDTEFFGRVLTLDDLVMLTERDEFVYHEMLVHIPLVSLPDPKSVLIIGGGDAGCVREALKHSVDRVVQCEIDERVTRVCEQFFPWVGPAVSDPRVELVFDDGAEYLRQNEACFDLIVVDSTDPTGPALSLFTTEFYSSVARALKPGGVMVGQTESPHFDAVLVGRVYEHIRGAFSHVSAYGGAIPTYPSGYWTWSYASSDRNPGDHADEAAARRVGASCRYYQPGLQSAAFQLPRFVELAISGQDPFAKFTARVNR